MKARSAGTAARGPRCRVTTHQTERKVVYGRINSRERFNTTMICSRDDGVRNNGSPANGVSFHLALGLMRVTLTRNEHADVCVYGNGDALSVEGIIILKRLQLFK